MRSGPGLQTAQLLSGLKPTFKALPIMPTQKLILLVTSRTRERVRVCTLLTLSEKQSWGTCPTAWAFILCWVRPPVLYYNQRRAFYNEQRNKQHELQLWILSDAKLQDVSQNRQSLRGRHTPWCCPSKGLCSPPLPFSSPCGHRALWDLTLISLEIYIRRLGH